MEGMDKIEKMYPSAEELSTIETSIKCTETDCTAIFRCKSNLTLHLARHHGNKHNAQLLLKSGTQKVYYCPCKSCIYHSTKSFKNMKYLKQHYLKVHSMKSHMCTKCHLGFPTECLKHLHEEYCGINFKCPECPAKYNCYDTLTTHARRKGHKIFPKIKYKALFNGDVSACSRIICVVDSKPEKTLILPKDFLHEQETSDKTTETKTVGRVGRKRKNKSEMQTQTHIKAVKSTAGTQTEVVSVVSKVSASTSTSTTTSTTETNTLLKKSIKTQTITVTSSSRACNTSFDINLVPANDSEVERNTLGTQTLSPNISAHSVVTNTTPTHADQSIGTEDLIQSYINDIANTNFCNADMETQTDWLTNLDLLSNDVHSNNYTQTCDDILPPDLRFYNTHTQTVLNDILRSVGSQTNMRVNGGVFTNNETQTDSIFEELLQEINS